MLRDEKVVKEQPVLEAQVKLDEIKERYFEAVRIQTEKLSVEREKVIRFLLLILTFWNRVSFFFSIKRFKWIYFIA